MTNQRFPSMTVGQLEAGEPGLRIVSTVKNPIRSITAGVVDRRGVDQNQRPFAGHAFGVALGQNSRDNCFKPVCRSRQTLEQRHIRQICGGRPHCLRRSAAQR